MNDNIITFPATASIRTATYGEPAGFADSVTELFQPPVEGRFGTVADSQSASDFTLTLGEIWDALCNSRVRVHYQPQYNIATGEIAAAEALVRLIDTDGQHIYPDRFIDLVEQSDLIVPLGRAVIEQVCADLASCRSEGVFLQRVAINLSGHQLSVDTELPSFIDQVVTRYGLQYTDLEFELTERQALLPDSEGMSVLRTLARRGARLVIDDFGMGYATFEYLTLTDLPISAIKLDRALVNRLPYDKTILCVVRSLLTLAADLELEVVAEGVETSAQSNFLVNAGCPYAQGFGYAKPMGIGDLQDLMAVKSAANHGHLYTESSLATKAPQTMYCE